MSATENRSNGDDDPMREFELAWPFYLSPITETVLIRIHYFGSAVVVVEHNARFGINALRVKAAP